MQYSCSANPVAGRSTIYNNFISTCDSYVCVCVNVCFIINLWLNTNFYYAFSFQLTQLWICDWLLEIRTTLWQDLSQDAELEKSVANMSLAGFQRDLACLRQLCQPLPVSVNACFFLINKIHTMTK